MPSPSLVPSGMIKQDGSDHVPLYRRALADGRTTVIARRPHCACRPVIIIPSLNLLIWFSSLGPSIPSDGPRRSGHGKNK